MKFERKRPDSVPTKPTGQLLDEVTVRRNDSVTIARGNLVVTVDMDQVPDLIETLTCYVESA